MAGDTGYQLSVAFASLTGAAGFPLALLAWRKFRGTPFGNVMAVLPVFTLVVTVYHPMLLVFPDHLTTALLVEAGGFALLVVFAAAMVRVHRRMSRGRV